MDQFALDVALILAAYILGSIPWGLILARLFAGLDIRRHGSCNIGASNVRRLAGNKLGLATLVLDIAKGALPALLAVTFSRRPDNILAATAILAAICGHMFPVFLKFKPSGKGVATAAGGFMVVVPQAWLVSVGVFLVTTLATRRISAGSISAAAALPLAVWLTNGDQNIGFSALIVAVLIIVRHRDNIHRLLRGEEPRWDKHPSANSGQKTEDP